MIFKIITIILVSPLLFGVSTFLPYPIYAFCHHVLGIGLADLNPIFSWVNLISGTIITLLFVRMMWSYNVDLSEESEDSEPQRNENKLEIETNSRATKQTKHVEDTD